MNASSAPLAPHLSAPPSADYDAVVSRGGFMLLEQFGVIEASGEDAATFLHGQLTNDIQHLDAASARLSGYCSAKGRLLASMLAWRAGDTIRLLLARELVANVQKRLSMFVLRAKAKLADITGELAVVGFAGDVRGPLSTVFDALPDGVHVQVGGASGALIRVPDAMGRPRYLWIGPKSEVEARLAGLEDKLARVSPIIWDWLDIRAGEARVTQAVVEQFVPQMVNYDVIGAVNFRKGCYPGQEVVARSQYRGTIKRRTVLAHIGPAADRSADPAAEHGADPAAHIAAGRELYHSADPAQPCGMIVNAAPAPHGGYDVLVEIKLAALDEGTVHLGSIDGAPLGFEALPYALPADS